MTLWLLLTVLWLYNAYLLRNIAGTALHIKRTNKDLRRVNA